MDISYLFIYKNITLIFLFIFKDYTLILLFYALNILLLLSGLLRFRVSNEGRCLAIVIIQTLFFLPLLAGEFLYLSYNLNPLTVHAVFFSEIIFALIWFSMARRLRSTTIITAYKSQLGFLIEIILSILITTTAYYFLDYRSISDISDKILIFNIFSPIYFSTIFLLISVIYTTWRIEQFWRYLNTAQRREYKFFVVGTYLICGVMAWSASYRLTYLTIEPKLLLLISVVLLLGWILMSYAVLRHRLLNRKIFVSRKIIYSFVFPSILATYLLGFGIISFIMRTFGLELSFVLKWFFLVLGLVVIVLLAISGKIRRRAHFFISTNFYINKYEYRDVWLALSHNLQGAMTEADVVKALRQALAESLYTTEFFIWVGDSNKGYKLVSVPETETKAKNKTNDIVATDPLIHYFETHSHFHLKQKNPDSKWKKIAETKRYFIESLNLRLLSPISIGNHLTGLIGLGPEYTGGKYGYDDFDLLSVLSSQTASALLAMRMAEELANSREQQAWSKLSAFVLHDIKNAATMLSMLQVNAPAHIHKPEFQQDMLELIDDAIRRMSRVEQRLVTLKDEIVPTFRIVQLNTFLNDCRNRMSTKLASMEIKINCDNTIKVDTDPALLFSVMENLLLNTFKEKKDAIVQINAKDSDNNEWAIVEILDNGQGIAEELLPDLLFEPFKTTKEGGSGIGLWQVKNVTSSIGGNISAENRTVKGARFILEIPK